jgi:two-component system NtrC family response regulator
VRARPGKFVVASGGTLFLDEIGDMPLAQQVALLSAIANRTVTPLGGNKPIPVDVRIITATNRNLRKLVESGEFREDLYFRLNVIEIEIPPLRERKADIPELARRFLEVFAQQQEREVPRLAPDFFAVLMRSDWPGNVRELQNYLERLLAMSPGSYLRADPPPRDLELNGGRPRAGHRHLLSDAVGEIERRMLLEALDRSMGNQSRAARELGLTEQSVRYRMKKYGLDARRNRRIRQD